MKPDPVQYADHAAPHRYVWEVKTGNMTIRTMTAPNVFRRLWLRLVYGDRWMKLP